MLLAMLEINDKKLFSIIKTRRYERIRLLKRQKSFEGIAMYGHGSVNVLTKCEQSSLGHIQLSELQLLQISTRHDFISRGQKLF